MSQIRALSHAVPALPFSPLTRPKISVSFGGNAMRFVPAGACRIAPVGNGVAGVLVAGWGRVGEMFPGNEKRKGGARGGRVVCTAGAAAFNTQTLHWISTISAVILMFARGTPIVKSFLPPYFVLQAPACVVSWFKSEYGAWTALLALLIHLFYHVPGEVELPVMAILLSITSPTQTLSLRGTPAAAIISLVIAGYLAYQHFSNVGSIQNAFDPGSIFSTLALVATVAVPLLLLSIY